MEKEYEWQKPLNVPRHDEPEAIVTLKMVLAEAAEGLGLRRDDATGEERVVGHPLLKVRIIDFFPDCLNGKYGGIPMLSVNVLPFDGQLPDRTYTFRVDGEVVITGKCDQGGGCIPDLPVIDRVQGWPMGVRHLFIYLAQVLRASASWELKLAENLEVLAPGVVGSLRYERGKRDGLAGLSPTDATLEYLKGYAKGRNEFILNQPAMR